MPGQQDLAEDLFGFEQMVQIGLRIIGAGRAGDGGLERGFVLGKAGVLDVERTVPGPGLAMAAGAGRQDAIEHVNAARDRFEDVERLANAHQITRPVCGQKRGCAVQRGAHGVKALADRKAADRIAVKADLLQPLGAFAAQVGESGALDNAEQRLAGAGAEGGLAARTPGGRQAHRGGGGGVARVMLGAFVELHGDIGAKQIGLDLDRPLGR